MAIEATTPQLSEGTVAALIAIVHDQGLEVSPQPGEMIQFRNQFSIFME